MKVIPAIDIHDGRCVRLLRGDFGNVTRYSDDPASVAERFAQLPVRDLHIVDLDGARSGSQQNAAIVTEICRRTTLDIQLGGGIRDRESVAAWLERGVARCVVGSIAVAKPETVREWIGEFGLNRIVVALDVADADTTPRVATHGWTRSADATLWDCLEAYAALGAVQVLCTDIHRDGALAGPNVDLYSEILRRFPGLQLQASGGIRHIGDIAALGAAGVPAAITGKALLDGRIGVTELESFLQSA